MIVIIILLVAFVFLLAYLKGLWTFSNLPPGPKGLPLFGNIFQQNSKHPHFDWALWAVKYGDIFTMWNFWKPIVVCNTFEALWEVLVTKTNAFADRPLDYVTSHCSAGGNDISFSGFNRGWMHRKKVAMTAFKTYGEDLRHLEDIIKDIIGDLVKDLNSTEGQPCDPRQYLEMTFVNITSLLLLGSKFKYEEDDFQQLLKYDDVFRDIIAQSSKKFAYVAFPVLHYLPLTHSKKINQYVDGFIGDWLPRQIQKAKTKQDRPNYVSVLNAFLKQVEEDRKTGTAFPLEEHHVIHMSANLFQAGIITSLSTMYALLAILTAKPDIQTRAREEVDQVLHGNHPTLNDKKSMPYMQALLEEVLRYTTIAPAILHKSTEDSTICGHFIPKDTVILVNLWFLCHDNTFWDDPFSFMPERFLDCDGYLLPVDHPKRKRMLVFGAGRRVCPGEQLARNRLFLITASLLQRFIFEPASEDHLPKYDPRMYKFGITIMPEPYKLRAIPRH